MRMKFKSIFCVMTSILLLSSTMANSVIAYENTQVRNVSPGIEVEFINDEKTDDPGFIVETFDIDPTALQKLQGNDSNKVTIEAGEIIIDDLTSLSKDSSLDTDLSNNFKIEIGESNLSKNESQTVADEVYGNYDRNNSVTAALPDLQVTVLAYNSGYPYPFTALGTSNFVFAVTNNGTVTANNVVCGLRLNGNLIATFSIGNLPSNYTFSTTLQFSGVPEGTHSVELIADYYNSISESNETNNALAKSFVWKGMPDLTVTSVTTSSTDPRVGSTIPFQFSFANIGNGMAKGVIYLDVLVDGVKLTSFSVSNMDYGQTGSGSFNLNFPRNGIYKVEVVIDRGNEITEINESNNAAFVNVIVKVAATINVSGTLRYRIYSNIGNNSGYNLLRNYNVEIYDKEPIGSTLKGTATTNSDGKFSINIPNEDIEDGCDIYISISMDNDYLKLTDQGVLFNDVYKFESTVFENYQLPTLDMGTITLDSSETMEGAFNIYHWIKRGKDFYESKAGSLGKVNVRWQTNGGIGSHYDRAGTIFLRSTINEDDNRVTKDHYDADVILHEYGHYIMDYKDRSPNNSGGKHYWDAPSERPGTAYSEAYAHFISSQARDARTVFDYDATGYYFGGNLENLTYHNSLSSPQVVERIETDFHKNAYMELFIAGAMHDFADTVSDGEDTFAGEFNEVNSIVMLSRYNNAIEFYNAFMQWSVDKVLAWKIFNQNHSAFDYELPSVSISGDRINGFVANATDNVGIDSIEWYLNNQNVATGNSYTPFPYLAPGSYILEARAYDFEGKERGNSDRGDINGDVIRTRAYGAAMTGFEVPAQKDMQNQYMKGLLDNLSIEIPAQNFIAADSPHIFTNVSETREISKNNKHTFSVSESTDVYITGIVNHSFDSIQIVNSKNEIVFTTNALYSDEFAVVHNLSAGEYQVIMKRIDDVTDIPYKLYVYTAPTKPELTLPEKLANNTIEIHNPYTVNLIFSVDEEDSVILPQETKVITLNEGRNTITYYTESKAGVSEKNKEVISVDSISPVVTISSARVEKGELIISGEISEYAEDFYINGDHIMLGEFNRSGDPIPFGYRVAAYPRIESLAISAVDYYGNSFAEEVTLIWSE